MKTLINRRTEWCPTLEKFYVISVYMIDDMLVPDIAIIA